MCLTLSKYIFSRSKVLWENHSIEIFSSQKSCISRVSVLLGQTRAHREDDDDDDDEDEEKNCSNICQNLLNCSLGYIYKHIGTRTFLTKALWV